MTPTRFLIALAPFLLTACGGGGGSDGSSSGGSSGGSESGRTVTPQAAVERNINDFINTLAASQSGATDADLTGVWIEAAADIRNENGVVDGSSYSGDTIDTIYHVHFVMDNGNSIDVSDCSTALTLYTFHYDDSGNLVWSNFKGDTKPVGTLTNNKQIDFGTTAYTGSKTTSSTDTTFSGDYTSRWIKLNTSLQATIGRLSGSGFGKDIACANLSSRSGEVDGDEVESYSVLFRDKDAEWISSTSADGDEAPTRSGKRFTLDIEGANVTFTLK